MVNQWRFFLLQLQGTIIRNYSANSPTLSESVRLVELAEVFRTGDNNIYSQCANKTTLRHWTHTQLVAFVHYLTEVIENTRLVQQMEKVYLVRLRNREQRGSRSPSMARRLHKYSENLGVFSCLKTQKTKIYVGRIVKPEITY